MRVTLNGVERQLAHPQSVIRLIRLTGVGIGEPGVAVAVDGEVVPRREWDTTTIREGSVVEIVRAAAGG